MAGLFQRQLERAPSIGVIFDHGDYTIKTGDIFTSAKGLAAGEHLQGILLMHDVICWPSGPASHPLPAARAAAMKSICRQGLLQDSSRAGGGGVCIAEAERWQAPQLELGCSIKRVPDGHVGSSIGTARQAVLQIARRKRDAGSRRLLQLFLEHIQQLGGLDGLLKHAVQAEVAVARDAAEGVADGTQHEDRGFVAT